MPSSLRKCSNFSDAEPSRKRQKKLTDDEPVRNADIERAAVRTGRQTPD